MPDRNDGVEPPQMLELGVFPDTNEVAPLAVHTPDLINENASDQLAGYVAHDQVADFLADNPAQFYTAFVRNQRPENVVFNLYNVSSLIAAGKRLVTGYSLYLAGATGPVLVRDGIDASAQVSFVIPQGGGSLMFGIDGLLFDYGVYIDLSLAGPVTAVYGGLYMRREFSE